MILVTRAFHFVELRLRNQAYIAGFPDPFGVDYAHPPEHIIILRIARQVFDLVRIGGGVVKFLDGLGFFEILFLRAFEPALGVETAHFLHRRHLVHIIDVLPARHIPHVVADILISFVAHGTNQVIRFVHPVTSGEDIFSRLGLLAAKERPALYVVRDFNAG